MATKLEYRPRDLDADVGRAAGSLEVMTYPKGMKFAVNVQFDDKIKKEILADKLLGQDMWLAVDKVYLDLVERIGDNLRKTDRGAIQLRNNKDIDKLKKLVEVVNRGILGARDVAQEAAEKQLQKIWNELQGKRKEYTKYKIKIVVTITSAAAGLVTSIALIGASGFSGGASGALGVIAMFKSCAVLATEIASAALTVDQSIVNLREQLAIVTQLWGKSKALTHANEVSAAVFKEFLGVSQPNFKQCMSMFGTAKSKLGGVDVNTHDMAKKVVKAQGAARQMADDFLAKANERLKKHPDPDALKKYGPKVLANLNKYMEKPNKEILSLLKTIGANDVVIKKATADLDALGQSLKSIDKIRANKTYRLLDNGLALANVALSSLNGNGLVEGAQAVKECVVPIVTLFAFDKITAVVIDGDLKSALS